MSRRIDIELTSSLTDGTWTWRAAGARQPRGVLDGSILPSGAKVGDEFKVEVDQEIDGITVLSVVANRDKQEPELLTLLPVEREFQPVIETRARRDRNERPRRDNDRRPRRDGDGDRADRPRRDGPGGDRGARDRGDRPKSGDRSGRDRDSSGTGAGRNRQGGRERRGPSFTPPPEVPQRPKPKRLRPGKTHRTAVLAELPPEQRPIAELALQGMGAVRTRLREENERAVAEGRPAMPEASVVKMAEELLPVLRVAEWRDRAEAAKAQAAELDLRDLRSVVAASGDPMVARDESTRALADELKQLLTVKQEQELQFWYGDIDAALAVGRVIRALRLSSQPPKAGVPFPTDIAQRLADSANASLTPMDAPDRWSAMLEAAAFSPVRALVRPARKPDVVSDELTATVTRLAPALPYIAELFGIEVPAKAPMPKPLRPTPRPTKGKPGEQAGERPKRGDRPARGPKPAAEGKPAPKGKRPQPSPDVDEQSPAEISAPADEPVEQAPAAVEEQVEQPAADQPQPPAEAAAPESVEQAPAAVEDQVEQPAADEPQPQAETAATAPVEQAPAAVEEQVEQPVADEPQPPAEAAAPEPVEQARAATATEPVEQPVADEPQPQPETAATAPVEQAPAAVEEQVEQPVADEPQPQAETAPSHAEAASPEPGGDAAGEEPAPTAAETAVAETDEAAADETVSKATQPVADEVGSRTTAT